MRGLYSKNTGVSVDKSLSEINRTLTKYGATSYMYGTQDSKAAIQFEMVGKRVRFVLPLEPLQTFAKDGRGAKRNYERQVQAQEQSSRQRFRALALAVKAKLEAVASGITTFEEEFLAHIVLPNGKTAGGWLIPQIDQAYQTKKMPPLLPGSTED